MDPYRTEEEQVEALKRWWKENGKSLIIGVLLAVAAVYGWRFWQQAQEQKAENASELFFQLVDATALVGGQEDNEAMALTAQHLANSLKQDYESSVYAVYGALFAAKIAVENDDLASARQELEWAVAHSDSGSSNHIIATLRLARVIYSSDEENAAQQAMALLDGLNPKGHEASYLELKGDIYASQGKVAEARQAYEEGLQAVREMGAQKPLVELKLNDLAPEQSQEQEQAQ